jgi:hypothetical protein
MIVKFMSDENAADDDSRKTFRLLSGVKTVEFVRGVYTKGSGFGPMAVMYMEDGSYHEESIRGNVYVMNDSGKTVSSFGIAGLPPENAAESASL